MPVIKQTFLAQKGELDIQLHHIYQELYMTQNWLESKLVTRYCYLDNSLISSSSLRMRVLKFIMKVNKEDEPLDISANLWLHMDLYSFS